MYRTGGGQNEIVASEIHHRIADAFAKEIYPLNNTKDSDSNFHGKDVILIDPVDKDNDIVKMGEILVQSKFFFVGSCFCSYL